MHTLPGAPKFICYQHNSRFSGVLQAAALICIHTETHTKAAAPPLQNRIVNADIELMDFNFFEIKTQ